MEQAISDKARCPCSKQQTMLHIVSSCRQTKLEADLQWVHSAVNVAVQWLMLHGLWMLTTTITFTKIKKTKCHFLPFNIFRKLKPNFAWQAHNYTTTTTSTTTTTTTTVLRPFVRDYLGEPVPEETLTYRPSWSSSNLYQLLPFTTIHSILPLPITCLANYHNYH